MKRGDETREKLLDVIRDQPGINKMQLCEATGLAWGTVYRHIKLLEACGEVDVHRDGREAQLFPAEVPIEKRRWLAALRRRDDDFGGRLAAGLGLNREMTRRYLRVLRDAGLLRQGVPPDLRREPVEPGVGPLAWASPLQDGEDAADLGLRVVGASCDWRLNFPVHPALPRPLVPWVARRGGGGRGLNRALVTVHGIFATIVRKPGLTLQGLSYVTGFSVAVVEPVVRLLIRGGVVYSEGNPKRFNPMWGPPSFDAGGLGV